MIQSLWKTVWQFLFKVKLFNLLNYLSYYPAIPHLNIYQRPGFPGGSDSKESTCNAGDLGSIPGLGSSPGGGVATDSSILAWRIPMDRRACWATVCGVAKSD